MLAVIKENQIEVLSLIMINKNEQLYAIISYQIIQVAIKSSGNMCWVFTEPGNEIKYFWFVSILVHAQFQSEQAAKS